MIDTIREIVDIESPSYDAEASRQVADWIDEKARETGAPLSVERVAVDDGEHVIIRAYPGSGPHTLLLGHTDTVHPKGTFERNPTRIEDDRFYGCGIFVDRIQYNKICGPLHSPKIFRRPDPRQI